MIKQWLIAQAELKATGADVHQVLNLTTIYAGTRDKALRNQIEKILEVYINSGKLPQR